MLDSRRVRTVERLLSSEFGNSSLSELRFPQATADGGRLAVAQFEAQWNQGTQIATRCANTTNQSSRFESGRRIGSFVQITRGRVL